MSICLSCLNFLIIKGEHLFFRPSSMGKRKRLKSKGKPRTSVRIETHHNNLSCAVGAELAFFTALAFKLHFDTEA